MIPSIKVFFYCENYGKYIFCNNSLWKNTAWSTIEGFMGEKGLATSVSTSGHRSTMFTKQ